MTLSPLLRELIHLHTYCRPYQSKTEQRFRDTWIRPLGATDDTCGNLHVVVGDAPVLFSCHTDTVHHFDGQQTVHYNAASGRLKLSKRSQKLGDCLGADDTVGVFLMRHMILAGVPGRYIFHSGEERGCIGSRSLAAVAEPLLETYHYAIAFDRKDRSDVITHQCGNRTASDTFAEELAQRLSAGYLLNYQPSALGLFTDTESYADIIPECTNLSIGYSGAHGSGETVDCDHVLRLLDRLVAIDWASLPYERDPHTREVATAWADYYRWDDCWGQDLTRPVIDVPTNEPDVCEACGEACVTRICLNCGHDPHDDDDRSIYLDQVYADTQAELRRRMLAPYTRYWKED